MWYKYKYQVISIFARNGRFWIEFHNLARDPNSHAWKLNFPGNRSHFIPGRGSGPPQATAGPYAQSLCRTYAYSATEWPYSCPLRGTYSSWQNRLNYFDSSAQTIAIQVIGSQRTSNGTTHWSVRSPPDSTTVTQDRRRFTSHEGESSLTTARKFYTTG
jgi:hypothetical protein